MCHSKTVLRILYGVSTFAAARVDGLGDFYLVSLLSMRAKCTQSINQQRKEINVHLKFNQAFKEIGYI